LAGDALGVAELPAIGEAGAESPGLRGIGWAASGKQNARRAIAAVLKGIFLFIKRLRPMRITERILPSQNVEVRGLSKAALWLRQMSLLLTHALCAPPVEQD
jgi:hypothetical protein